MTEALVVSNLLLWVLVAVLGAVVVALVRQIGLLHERIAPAGALMQRQGPEVGTKAPQVEVRDLDGRALTLGGAGPRTLLFFLSPTCPVCGTLLPTLRRVVHDESNALRLVLASDGDLEQDHRRFVQERGLAEVPYVLSTELGLAYQVAKLPTAVLIDEDGIVRARGLVNSREHLESLFLADDLDVATIQQHLENESAGQRNGQAKVISLHKISLRKEKPR